MCAFLFLCYSNTFQAAWQLDDKPNILNNRPIQIESLSPGDLWQSVHARPGSGSLHRPVAFLTLALNWYFGKDNVVGYHAVNLLIHMAAAWCLFLFLLALFQTPVLRRRYVEPSALFIAAVATLLWAAHPIQTQAVTYIVQRMTSLAAFFAVLALLCYLKGRLASSAQVRILFFMASAGAYLLALLTKENTALVFIAVPAIEVLFFRSRLSGKQLLRIGVGALIGVGACLLIVSMLRTEVFDFIFNYYRNRPFTMAERFLTEQRIVVYYLSLLVYPSPNRLSIDHDVLLSTSLISPWTTLAAITTNLLLILLGARLYRKNPLVTLAIFFYFLNHIIESTIVPLELIFEHRNYLPSMFLFLPAAQGLHFIWDRYQSRTIAAVGFHLLLAVAVAGLGYWTYTRNAAWRTERSLWIDAASKAPNSARPLAQLAILLAWDENPSEFKYRKALELTERTLSLRMSRRRLDAAQLANMASIHSRMGNPDEAYRYYEKSLAIAPKDAKNRFNYVKTLVLNGDFPSARGELETLFDLGYSHPDYFYMAGFTHLWLGEPQTALLFLRRALAYAPHRPDVLLAIGSCMSELNRFDRALWFFSRAQQKGGQDIIVSLSMLQNALKSGNHSRAKKAWEEIVSAYPVPYIQARMQPTKDRYRSVPVYADILTPFIQQQIGMLTAASSNHDATD